MQMKFESLINQNYKQNNLKSWNRI